MSVSGIGVKQIVPRSGAGWKDANPSAEAADDTDNDRSRRRKSRDKPPEPGTGQVVDKIA